jgi:hypothetical protein
MKEAVHGGLLVTLIAAAFGIFFQVMVRSYIYMSFMTDTYCRPISCPGTLLTSRFERATPKKRTL